MSASEQGAPGGDSEGRDPVGGEGTTSGGATDVGTGTGGSAETSNDVGTDAGGETTTDTGTDAGGDPTDTGADDSVTPSDFGHLLTREAEEDRQLPNLLERHDPGPPDTNLLERHDPGGSQNE